MISESQEPGVRDQFFIDKAVLSTHVNRQLGAYAQDEEKIQHEQYHKCQRMIAVWYASAVYEISVVSVALGTRPVLHPP